MARPNHIANQYTPSPYDKDKHPKQLIALFSQGNEVSHFCAENNIGRKTFYDWLDRHEEFAEAYEVGKIKAQAFLYSLGMRNMESPHFQTNVWSMLMRNRCDFTEHRKLAIDFTKCKTSNERIEVLEHSLRLGLITTMEARHLAETIKCVAEVNEKTEVAQKVDELMKLAGKK